MPLIYNKEKIECYHRLNCVSYGVHCGICKNNKSKKDFFEPEKEEKFEPFGKGTKLIYCNKGIKIKDAKLIDCNNGGIRTFCKKYMEDKNGKR